MSHPTHAASAAGVLRLVFYLKDFNLGWEIDMTVSVLGVDLATSIFYDTRGLPLLNFSVPSPARKDEAICSQNTVYPTYT
jgi:hypothetical protein